MPSTVYRGLTFLLEKNTTEYNRIKFLWEMDIKISSTIQFKKISTVTLANK